MDALGDDGSSVHNRGSSSVEPRGWAVMQEAAAAAFCRGSCPVGRNRLLCKALTLQVFPPVIAMANTGRKGVSGARVLKKTCAG